MKITDAQVHIWGGDTPERPWPKRTAAQRLIPLGTDALIREMDAAGVERVILVPPSWEGDRNDLAIEGFLQHPTRFRIMGRFDTDAPNAKKDIQRWTEQPGMLGVRFIFSNPLLQEPLLAGRMDWFWEVAERRGLPVMALFPYDLMNHADRIAERHPNLKLVVDHMGLTGSGKDQPAFEGFENMLVLSRHANVAVKASAIPVFTSDPYPYRNTHQYIKRTFEAFGPKRMFWGSDLSRLPCTYRQCITLFTEELPWLSKEDLEWIMGRGINEYLGWQ